MVTLFAAQILKKLTESGDEVGLVRAVHDAPRIAVIGHARIAVVVEALEETFLVEVGVGKRLGLDDVLCDALRPRIRRTCAQREQPDDCGSDAKTRTQPDTMKDAATKEGKEGKAEGSEETAKAVGIEGEAIRKVLAIRVNAEDGERDIVKANGLFADFLMEIECVIDAVDSMKE